jgi:23S rRNA pseudouridine955/2504/2580 synthase
MQHLVQSRTVDADEAGMRVDRWFREHYPDLPFGLLQKLLRSGQIRVDGGRVKTSTRLQPGQSVRVPPLPGRPAAGKGKETRPIPRPAAVHEAQEPGAARRAVPGSRPARGGGGSDADLLRSIILYEDDDVMVINKPYGLAVQGGSGLTRHIDAMLEAFRDARGQKPRLVHRLDRDTTGVLVIARTRLAAQKLAAAFRTRSTRKIYWALVAGVPKPKQGRISTWLAREGARGTERMRVARHGEEEASHAETLYSVVDQAGQRLAWLTMRPVTGRTHQLRAHAAHIGHPIVGDPKYFDRNDWELPGGIQNRLHLHARRIVMPHPSGGTLDVTAPLPDHMQQSWNLLGFDIADAEGSRNAD